MSEKIYVWLWRLYPSRFRDAYGDAARQLFRDRVRDEKGFFPCLRLWLDLLADLAISVPRQYRYVQPALIGASAPNRPNDTPLFHVLEGESPCRGALFLGGALALVMLAAFPASISHFGNYRPPHASILAQGAYGSPQPPAQPPKPQGAPVVESVNQDAAERRRVIHAAIANLKERYIDPGAAQKIADTLLAHLKNGDYDAVPDGPAFAGLLTSQMREVSQDLHLDLIYSQSPLPDRPPGPAPESRARYRQAMEQENCTFEKVEILPHNIGYLKLNSFPDPSVCQPTAVAAMASLNHADAIVFDLRDNRGGYPAMVMLLAAYLFDHPEYLYTPLENTSRQSWTQSPVPGNRLADKPAYLLTSARTASAAEHFAYNLKMLKRATLVGETTRGVAHAGVFHRIDEHFGIAIPETRPINPFSNRDWEGTGVEPDVKVKAADALVTAEKLAVSKLRKK